MKSIEYEFILPDGQPRYEIIDLLGIRHTSLRRRYDASTDKYVECDWNDAFTAIASEMKLLDPKSVVFYASGRASLETSNMYGLLARMYGCSNLPDSSNMCHESTSVGLKQSLGSPVGTVTLDDFEHTDRILFFGQKAVEDAEPSVNSLFSETAALKEKDHAELHAGLTKLAEKPDESGSFMATVHKTVIGVRAATTGLGTNSRWADVGSNLGGQLGARNRRPHRPAPIVISLANMSKRHIFRHIALTGSLIGNSVVKLENGGVLRGSSSLL